MKIKTEFWAEVKVWQSNEIIVEVDSIEEFYKLVEEGRLLSDSKDLDYVESEFCFETMEDTGNYDFESTIEKMEIIQ